MLVVLHMYYVEMDPRHYCYLYHVSISYIYSVMYSLASCHLTDVSTQFKTANLLLMLITIITYAHMRAHADTHIHIHTHTHTYIAYNPHGNYVNPASPRALHRMPDAMTYVCNNNTFQDV